NWMQEAFSFQSADRVIQRTPVSFDASVWEFYAPLLCGAELVMHTSPELNDTIGLIDEIIRKEVTVIQLVPSLLQMLLSEPEIDGCKSLRCAFAGGEALSPELESRFFSRSGAILTNLYGPSEACIDSVVWTCDRDGRPPTFPIGRLISTLQSFVLASSYRPAPVGVPGELNTSGNALSRAYLNRPDYTAAKFIPNPFSSSPGSRLYRSGDLARYNSLGRLHFLGRIDTQVKLRGFRIELAEIDALLPVHPSVKDAVVSALPFAPDDLRLVAYIVPVSPNDSFSTSELRSFLLTRLPDFMIPAAFVVLDSLPLSPNGKVNR